MNNFDGILETSSAELSDFCSTARLAELLEFSREGFDKQITLNAAKRSIVTSKWPLDKLGKLAEVKKGTSITQAKTTPGNVKVVAGGVTHAYLHNVPNRLPNTITISASGANAGFVNFWKEPIFASDCTTVRGKDDQETKYLYAVLKARQSEIQAMAKGAAQPHVYPDDLKGLEIPVVDEGVRDEIIGDCEAVDLSVAKAQTLITQSQAAIDAKVAAVYASAAPLLSVDEISTDVQYGLSEKMNEAGIGYRIFRMNEISLGRMVDNGAMKCADISAEEFAKYRLNRGDLLFNRTNSIEHVGKTGLFDLDGNYCFASYLVRVVPDTNRVLPLFLCLMMNSPAFQQEAKSKASKSINQANINATIMRNLKVPVPTLDEQRRLVAEVETLQQRITEAQAIIDSALARKSAILQKHL